MSNVLTYPRLRDETNVFEEDPDLKALAPIDRVEIWDGTTPWLIRDHQLYRTLIADPRISNDVRRDGYPSATPAFRTMRVQKDGLLSFDRQDGEEHMKSRKAIMKFMSVRRMAAIRPKAEAHLSALLDGFFASGQPADLVENVTFNFAIRVLGELLGLPSEELKPLQDKVERIAQTDGLTLDEIMVAHADVRDYIRENVYRVRDNPTDGALSEFVRDYLVAGRLTERVVVENTISMLLGGFETTANAIALGTAALMQHRDQWEDLVANADDQNFVANAVEELLRYVSLIHWGRRRVATEDIDLGDVVIRAGEGVIFDDIVANRDPDVFAGDPSKLDLRRDARQHLAFAAGSHHCPGNQLARMELQIYFRMMAQRAPELALADDISALRFKKNAQIFGMESLNLTW